MATPKDSTTAAMMSIRKIFAILQILVTNQTDIQFSGLRSDVGIDQSIEFMLKLAKRRMRVKLGISLGKQRQESLNIFAIDLAVLQQPEYCRRAQNALLKAPTCPPPDAKVTQK